MTEKRLYCRVQFSAIGNNTEGKDVMKVMTMKKPERAAITVRLPQALYDKLKIKAEERSETLNGIIRRIFWHHFEKKNIVQFSTILTPKNTNNTHSLGICKEARET